MEEKKLILGLDVSTKTLGVCLMSVEGDKKEIIKLTYCSPKINSKIKGIEGMFLKKIIFENEFINQFIGLGITNVIIEEPLIYGPNARSVAPLLKFNSLVSESIYRLLGIVPEYISSYDARAFGFKELVAKRKFDKKGELVPESKYKKSELVLFGEYPIGVDKKRIILDKVSDLFPKINWIMDKKGEIIKESFDSSDSVCCILGWLNKMKEESLVK
jgi:hypothetical protein